MSVDGRQSYCVQFGDKAPPAAYPVAVARLGRALSLARAGAISRRNEKQIIRAKFSPKERKNKRITFQEMVVRLPTVFLPNLRVLSGPFYRIFKILSDSNDARTFTHRRTPPCVGE